MKKNRGLVLALLLALLWGASAVYADEPWVLSSMSNSQLSIVSEHVVRAAYRRIGLEISIRRFPNKRSLLEANAGRVKGELFRIGGIEKQFSNLEPVPVPIGRLDGVVFSKQHQFKVDGWESLRPYRVGIRRGTQFAEEGTRGFNREVVNNHAELFKMLDRGRLDVVVAPRINGIAALKALGLENIRILEPPLVQLPLYHYLHKSDLSLMSALTESLEQMQNAGRIDQITLETVKALQGENVQKP